MFVNALAEELFGYSEAELLGRPISDAVARARARALRAQHRAVLPARAPAALLRARLRAAPRRLGVHRRDELGDRRRTTTGRCCWPSGATSPSAWRPSGACAGSPRSRPRSPRSGERALRGVAPGDLAREAAERVGMALSAERVLIVEPPRRRRRDAGRARRVGRGRGPAGRAGGRAGRDARAGAGRGRRRLERRDPHGRGGVRRDHGLRHARRRRSSARSSSRSPTCSPRPTRACARSSASATRRCTTR